jgi:putative ABC transport system permease protein
LRIQTFLETRFQQIQHTMNFQFIKIFLRNNTGHPVISGINVLGLVLGLLSTALTLEYVIYQRSFENYNTNASRVYRVAYNRYQEGKLQWKTANSFYPTGSYLKDNFGEVEDFAVISMKYNITVSYDNPSGNKVFYNEEKTYYATPPVFGFFGIALIAGTPDCLDEPNTVAISESIARKYFGNKNPLGERIRVNYTENYTVRAIYKTIAENSHLKSGFLFSLKTLLSQQPYIANDWNYDYYHTYLMLKPGTDYKAFTVKAFPSMISHNYQEILTSSNSNDEFYLQPIRDIHLKSNIEYETEQPVNGNMVAILFGFSIFFLIVAWINYINMITARAVERARETALKKVNGAKKAALILQFIIEAFLLNGFCLLIALVIFAGINPYYISYTGILAFSLDEHGGIALISGIVFLSGILLSSLYPAFVLSSCQPMDVVKGRFKNSPRGILFRKILVTFQFIISLFLLIGTFAAYKQIRYLDEKEMGIDYRSTLVIRAPQKGNLAEQYNEKLLLLKNSIAQVPSILDITITSDIPGREINHWFAGGRKGFTSADIKAYFLIMTDEEFFDFYKIRFLAGRGFRNGELPEQHHMIMNLSAMKRFGFDSPEKALNEIMVDYAGKEWIIVGITDDFYYYSKKTEPVPTIMTLDIENMEFLSMKMNHELSQGYLLTLKQIKKIYEDVFPDRPYEVHFLKDDMERDLKPENTFISIFGTFSALAILVSVIGILGLLLININQNLKELAIRKSMGAGTWQMAWLISRSSRWPFIVATVIAIPCSYYGLKHWLLNNYVHHIPLHPGIFFLPVLFVVLVVSFIVLLISIRINNIRISEVLQYE